MMPETVFHDAFDGPDLSPQLRWQHPPQLWSVEDGALIVRPDAQTDYWQRTHYGFQADNGHFLYVELDPTVHERFVLSTRVRFQPAHQYDQAGLMVRISPDCWLKTSVEYEQEEPNRLGAVVTNQGYSDWSTQDFSDEVNALSLRVRRERGDYFVEYALTESSTEPHWTQIRLAKLLADDGHMPIRCGLYACSPKDAGFRAAFDYMTIAPG